MSPTYDSGEFPRLDGGPESEAIAIAPEVRRAFRTSIVWKLTLFVGVLVALNTGLLIGAAYFATSAILRDQVHDRLTTVAGDRQEMLVHGLKQDQDQAASFAGWPRMRSLVTVHARAAQQPRQFQDGTEAFLSNIRDNVSGLLAIWIEDEAGRMIAATRTGGFDRRAFAGGANPVSASIQGGPGRAAPEDGGDLSVRYSPGSCGPTTTASWGP